MDKLNVDEGSLPNKLPRPLLCKPNKIIMHTRKLKRDNLKALNLTKQDPVSRTFENNATFLLNFIRKENSLQNEKMDECLDKPLNKKAKTKNELYEEERKILLEDFENFIKDINEEEANKILHESCNYYENYKSALKVKEELRKVLKINFDQVSLLNNSRNYLKKNNGNPKEKTLILEIKGILQYITGIAFEDFDIRIPVYKNDIFLYTMYIKNRKYIGEFLLTMVKNFEVIIFSEMFEDSILALTRYLEEILNLKFDYVIGSSHSFYKNSSMTVKNINCLSQSRLMENIIIVDHNLNNSCVIFAPEFKGKEENKNFLKYLAKVILKKANLGKKIQNENELIN